MNRGNQAELAHPTQPRFRRGRWTAALRPLTPSKLAAAMLVIVVAASAGHAQQDSPVYVDDSPQAWELFQQAQDQARDNLGESVRLYQSLLDDFPFKLIPAGTKTPSQFAAVRIRVLDELRRDERLLERYRSAQTPEAQRLLDLEEFERLAVSRPLTAPGLEALLRMGQQSLEASRFRAAVSWLQQAADHPDLDPQRGAHCWYMLGAAAHYLADQAWLDGAIQALTELGPAGETLLAHLRTLVERGRGPEIVRGISVLDTPSSTPPPSGGHDPSQGLSDLVAEAIWSVPLKSAAKDESTAQPAGIRVEFAPGGGMMEEYYLLPSDMPDAAVTVAGPLVYLNEGHKVTALNRLTGREAWPPFTLPRGDEQSDPEQQPVIDLNSITVQGDSLVTLIGNAFSNVHASRRRIVCLDARTGKMRWPAPAAVDTALQAEAEETIFPHGQPVITDGLVCVLALKVSRQSLTSAYVVALDLESGAVRWTRFIASSGGLQRTAHRGLAILGLDDGELFVATNLGAIAKLSATQGEIQWLRRFEVPIVPSIQEAERKPWEILGPVITDTSVIAIQPDQRRLVVLDRQTGQETESHSITAAATWDSPRYLLADGRMIYAVGSGIRAFDLSSLDTPVWRLPAPPTQTEDQPREAPPRLDIRGRVQLLDDALVVPSGEGLLIVDSQSGQIRNQLRVRATGNPLAADSQLFLAAPDRLDAYMSFSRAESMLRERIAQTPADPEPALSLLRLGQRVRNMQLALEGAELAAAAIDASPHAQPAHLARTELLSALLEIGREKIPSTLDEGEALFAMIQTVAADPQQRVEYLLTYGDWLTAHSLARAVETYQGVLSDQALAALPRTENSIQREARDWAAQRVRALIAMHGPGVYAPQADYARRQLNEIRSHAQANVPDAPNAVAERAEELIAISREFPLAETAGEAAEAAAAILAQSGNARAALAALAEVHHAAPELPHARRMLGAIVAACLDAGWNDQAESVLRHFIHLHGDAAIPAADDGRTASQWLLTFAGSAAAPVYPRLGDLQLTAEELPGRLVPFHFNAAGDRPANSALVLDDGQLRLLNTVAVAPPALEPNWSVPFESDAPQILRIDADHALLLTQDDPYNPQAALFNLADGQQVWLSQPLAGLVNDPAGDAVGGSGGLGVRGQMPDGEPFDPLAILPLVGRDALLVIQRAGGVAALDLKNGRDILWKNTNVLEQIHLAQLADCGLVLAGMQRPSAGGQSSAQPREMIAEGRNAPLDNGSDASDQAGLTPVILVLDPSTGHVIHRICPFSRCEALSVSADGNASSDDAAGQIVAAGQIATTVTLAGPKWLVVDQLGTLVYGTGQGIQVVDLFSGRVRWTILSYAATETRRAWLMNDMLVVEDRTNRLRSIGLNDGRYSEPFDTPVHGDPDPVDLREALVMGDLLAAKYRQRIVMYDRQGRIAGADVILDEPREYKWLLPASDRLLLVSFRTEQALLHDGVSRRLQYIYRVYPLSPNGSLLGSFELEERTQRLTEATLLDGWLLLSDQNETVAVPLPVGP